MNSSYYQLFIINSCIICVMLFIMFLVNMRSLPPYESHFEYESRRNEPGLPTAHHYFLILMLLVVFKGFMSTFEKYLGFAVDY